MDNTNILISYSKGTISHEEFKAELETNPSLWNSIQALMPSDISDPNCPFRSLYGNVLSLEANNYLVKPALLAFGYRSGVVYDLVSKLVLYQYPDTQCQEPLDRSIDGFLFDLRLDDLEGKETESFIRSFLQTIKDDSRKIQRQKILSAFHIENSRHRPRWVQESEWPMGKNSPMKFERQEKHGELVKFFFVDVDTSEEKVVEQLY